MKKDLKTAMAKNFQKMVNEQPTQDTPSKKSETVTAKKEEKKAATPEPEKVKEVTPVINEPVEVVPEPVPPVQVQATVELPQQPIPHPVVQPVQQPVVQQIPEPVAPVQPQPMPVQQPVPVYVQTPVQPIAHTYVETPVVNPTVQTNISPVFDETQAFSKVSSKKSIPLVPEEKSSGVLHIRLGELRSYVDFMTQSGKISYQQYISNLIEQDYEKNKDLYLKYKSFMEQLNM
ncbi:MAG: hypothetical protein K6G06_03885 [Butyrivibrio sp.]|nr:hypothetical protein [Butyrivibrio sp.]